MLVPFWDFRLSIRDGFRPRRAFDREPIPTAGAG
jgi:hypothetical protein